jgi:hydrogenase nickel incorporation protein HypB
MCENCGCGESDEFTVRIPGEEIKHEHDHKGDCECGHDHDHHHHEHDHHHGGEHEHHHSHEHEHGHEHEHELHHQHSDANHHDHKHKHHHDHEDQHHKHHGKHGHNGHSYEHASPVPRVIDISKDILSENNITAERNRSFFEEQGILCLNLVSAPGSGKTTLLERTISERGKNGEVYVIEGDQQSMNDAERIKKTGVPVVQINTGAGCHLDARMVHSAIKRLELSKNSVLFVENVGNLVCPALFDLGETKRVVVMSVTEGEDKPEKYPYMFASSHLCIINKTDLLPYVDFNVEKAMEYARRSNPDLEILLVSAKTGEGMQQWYEWIDKNQ